VIRRCTADEDHKHRQPHAVLGSEQKPLTRRNCSCQSKKGVSHLHPEPERQNESLPGAGGIQQQGHTGPMPPWGLPSTGVGYGGLILATLHRAPGSGTHGVGQEHDADSHLPCVNLQIMLFFSPSITPVCSMELDRLWHRPGRRLVLGDGAQSRPEMQGECGEATGVFGFTSCGRLPKHWLKSVNKGRGMGAKGTAK